MVRLSFEALSVQFVLGVLLLAAIGGCTVNPQVRSIIVNDRVAAEGGASVRLIRAGAEVPLMPGTLLEPGDEISTGPDAQAVLILENGAVEAILFENSTIRYSSIFLELGEIYVRVKRRVRDWVGVESEYIAASPETTGYIVRVDANERYACEVLEGKVTLRAKRGEWSPVRLASKQRATGRRNAEVRPQRLSTTEYNKLVDRINHVERIYRPGAAELMAPDVTRMPEAEARRVLSQHGFRRVDSKPVVTGKGGVGEVVEQSPRPGARISPRASMRIDVEVQPAVVPNLVGARIADARRRLGGAGLKVGRVSERLEEGSSGGIVRAQSRRAGEQVVPDTEIDLEVSAAAARVPDLGNRTRAQAESALQSVGLRLGSVSTEPYRAKAGAVIRHHPEAGELVAAGGRVNIVLADRCTVPDVMWNSQRDAEAKVRAAMLEPALSGSPGSDHVVYDQSPQPNARRDCGSRVTLQVRPPQEPIK